MSTCKQCYKEFSKHLLIDGKPINTYSRTKCFECSPINKNGGKILTRRERPSIEGLDKTNCQYCSREIKIKKKKYLTCGTCVSIIARYKFKIKCVEYKGEKCSECGYKECLEALVFHHIDDSTKDFGIANKQTIKWDKVVKEIDKCVLLCANCHTKTHADENWKKKGKILEDYGIKKWK